MKSYPGDSELFAAKLVCWFRKVPFNVNKMYFFMDLVFVSPNEILVIETKIVLSSID